VWSGTHQTKAAAMLEAGLIFAQNTRTQIQQRRRAKSASSQTQEALQSWAEVVHERLRSAALTLAVPDLHPTGKKRLLQLKTDNFGFAQWPHFHPVGS